MLFEICWGPKWGASHLLQGWLASPAGMLGKTRWVARTFPDAQAAEGLRKLFPQARFVYIHRDGTEVVASRTKYEAFRDEPFEAHCDVWAQSANKFRYLTELDCCMTVTHDQLLQERRATFQSIMAFLNLKEDEGPANFAESTVLIPRDIPRAEQRRSGVDATKLLKARPPSYLQWNEEQRSAFKRICGPAMQELGYEVPF
jgi:hypothetical protein